MANRLKEIYLKEVQPKIKEELGISNVLAMPKIEKIVISVGLGEAKDNQGILDKVKKYIGDMSGQMPVVTKAKKSIAAFKLVQGQPIGVVVTLRGDKMFSFLDKFINIVLPRVRDFKGLPDTSFDASGNLNIGLREQIIFPEVDYRTVDKTRGLAITIVTTAENKEHGKRLLELFGMPFRKGQNGEN